MLDLISHPDRKGLDRIILSNFGKSGPTPENLLEEVKAARFFATLLGCDKNPRFNLAFLSEEKETLDAIPGLVELMNTEKGFFNQMPIQF